MPEWILPATFLALLSEFRPIFTAPSFANFEVLVCGFVHALGGHRISDGVRAAGALASKHYCTYYRFFSHARWSLDELGLAMLALIAAVFPGIEVEIVVDDTLCRRTGKKVALGTMHADPVLRQGGKPFQSYGHVFVVLAVHIRVPLLSETGWALPFMFRLFEGPRVGGRADSPSDQRRAHHRRRKKLSKRARVRKTDRKVVRGKVVACPTRKDTGPLPDEARPTKLQLAAEMLVVIARRFSAFRFRVLADHLYAGNAVLQGVLTQVNNVSFVMRGRPDAALYALPPPPGPGARGRRRVKGERLQNPEQWAAAHPEAFEEIRVELYGQRATMQVASFEGMAYRSLPGRLVRYVIARDPIGIYKTSYFFSTDLNLTAAQIVAAFGRRWPLEQTFRDAKQKLGIEDPQTQLPAAVRRSAPFGLLLYSLVVLWYVTDGHREAASLRAHRDPWYAKTTRPSFSEMRAALRRCGWAKAFADPAHLSAARSKTLASYLARVAAAA